MDKQMIKEMAKEIAKTLFDDCLLNNGGHCEDCECIREETKEYDCQSYLVAKKLLGKYQPKIPEGAVVLTEEEYKKLKHGSGALEKLYNQYPFRVLVGFNSMVFCQDRECFERLYNEIEERARKEAAEKFAEMAREGAFVDFMGEPIIRASKIDEICKKITEGKDNATSRNIQTEE